MFVKPSRLLILLGYIAAMFSLIMLMSPKEITFDNGFSIKIFSWTDLLRAEAVKSNVDMDAIKALESSIDSLESNTDEKSKDLEIKEKATFVPEKLNKDIQLPPNNPDALSHFFDALNSISEKSSFVRIVHYGDSQIEGDRISEYLRNRLQKRFGGCGVGMVPVTEIKNIRSTMMHENSENMVRYEVFGAHKKPSLHNHYGYLGSYHKFAYQLPDSLGDEEPKWVTGKLLYKKPYMKTYKRVALAEKIKIAYRNRFSPLVIKGKINESTAFYDSLGLHQNVAVWETSGEGSFSSLDLELLSKGDPEVFGVSFDCEKGIALDNAPFRGSSGIEFTAMNKDVLRQQIKKLDVKFMILQFGVNVIPYVRMEYSFYKKSLSKQLKFLKSLDPDLDILVIGPSDMARKKGDQFVSYPNVQALRDAMKEAAFESGCAFWDLYGAMGGRNSIVSWVEAEPALANPDYTHFTRRGAKLVGEMFYNALMKAYNSHKANE